VVRYQYCEVLDIRCWMEKRLEKLPASTNQRETAGQFWARVEQAGLLIEAIGLYDEIAAEWAEWQHTRRETKKQFEQRMEREGRQAEAEKLRAELLASGLTKRRAQAELVHRLQPRDGSATRAWRTPDPWDNGRLFKQKANQEQVLALISENDADEPEELAEARNRLWWAELRRDEREALANARQRARALKQEQERQQQKKAASPAPAANGKKQETAYRCSDSGNSGA